MAVMMRGLAVPTFRRFAQRWDYALHVEDLPTDGSGADAGAQQAKWAKIRLLREGLGRYPLVLWLDADVLLARDDEDIAIHLRPEHFQALYLERVPHENRSNPNTGVWLMRSCPAAFAFLDAVEAAGPQPGPWADQGAVLAALGWHRGDANYHGARPGASNPFTQGTGWLPAGWNQHHPVERAEAELFNSSAQSYRGRPVVAEPHALHFMGLTTTARHRHMAAAADTITRARPYPTRPAGGRTASF